MPGNFFLVLLILAFTSCDHEIPTDKAKADSTLSRLELVKLENLTPTVSIREYKLIVTGSEDRKSDANEILELKRKWPLVMQQPNRLGFDTILSRNFTFTGDGHLLNHEEYIEDRIQPSDWKITHVEYDNLTLQFFGSTAVLTYRNRVTNENIYTKEIEIESISWADIYVKEAGKWKIDAAHTVDFRLEKK